MEKKLYWCSWVQPTEDFRPIYFPPTENVLAWWRSGEAMDGQSHTLCAWVQALNIDDLVKQVQQNWPEIVESSQFRFFDLHKKYKPSSRFPTDQYEWMNERLKKWK